MMNFLYRTKDDVLKFSLDGSHKIKWYVDAAFAVHPDMRSHTGAITTMGRGATQFISSKQKMNTRSSTEAELVAVDDVIAQILWTLRFLLAQGYPVEANVLLQDNSSAIKFEILDGGGEDR